MRISIKYPLSAAAILAALLVVSRSWPTAEEETIAVDTVEVPEMPPVAGPVRSLSGPDVNDSISQVPGLPSMPLADAAERPVDYQAAPVPDSGGTMKSDVRVAAGRPAAMPAGAKDPSAPGDSGIIPEMPPAIRLSSQSKLPAAVMAISDGFLSGRSEQVRAVAERIVDDFYLDLAREVAEAGGWQDKVVEDPETGEQTLEVETGPELETARRRADERFRLMFGDAAYNSYLVSSGVERMLAGDSGIDLPQ